MRNLLALTMALLLVVGAVGWYLDWFKVATSPAPNGHMTLNIDWNSLKFHQDLSKGTAKIAEIADQKAKDEASKVEAEKKAKLDAEKAPLTTPTKPGASEE